MLLVHLVDLVMTLRIPICLFFGTSPISISQLWATGRELAESKLRLNLDQTEEMLVSKVLESIMFTFATEYNSFKQSQ